MNVSQLRYPVIVYLGLNTSIASLYVSNVSEMLQNTPKHQFASNVVEWMLQNFGSEIVHSGSDTSYATCTCQMLAKCSETLHINILGPMD
jgi:hypothetical protein